MDINNQSIPSMFTRKITLTNSLLEKLNSSSVDTHISFDLDRTTLLTDDDYLTNLYNYLLSIRSLFMLRLDDTLSSPIQKKIEDCIDKLSSQGLLEKLITLLDSQKLFESSYKVLDIEIKVREITSEIIYQFCYQTEITNTQSIRICELLYDISSIYCENKNENLYKIIYRLLCSIIVFLRFNPKRKVLNIKNMNESIEEFTLFDYINRVWTFKDIEIILNLLYGLSLIKDKRNYLHVNEDNEYITKAISNNFSEALLSLIDNEIIRNDTSTTTKFIYAIDELISCFIMLLPSEINRMKNSDNETSNFKYLMNLIAFIYKDEPNLTSKYWHQGLISIISIGLEVVTTRFDDYINMLISLSSGESSSLLCYEYLDEISNKSFGWFKLFKILENFSHDIKKNFESKEEEINEENDLDTKPSNIYSILKLIGSIAKCSEISREKFVKNTYFMLFNSLANILKYCNDRDLKSEVYNLLKIFSIDTTTQPMIWNILLKNESLPQTIDSTDKDSYPGLNSGAFLSLLNSLYEYYQPTSQKSLLLKPWSITEIINRNLISAYDIKSSFYQKDKREFITESLKWNFTILRRIELFDYGTLYKILKAEHNYKVPQTDAGISLKLFLEYLYESQYQNFLLQLICDFVSSDRDIKNSLSILEYGLYILDFILSRLPELLNIASKLGISHMKKTSLDRVISQSNYYCLSIVKCITFNDQRINTLSLSIIRKLTQRKSNLKNLLSVYDDSFYALAYANKLNLIIDSLSYSKLSLTHTYEVYEDVIQEILLLLIENSSNPLPNLTYTLLIEHGNKRQSEGKKDPYIFLHYIIKLLNHPIIYYIYPVITSLCFELVYKLLYYSPTQQKVISALKSNGFFLKQLSRTPIFDPIAIFENLYFPIDQYEDYVSDLKTEFLHQKAWFVKAIGFYLHICQSKDEEHVYKIIDHLYMNNTKKTQYMNLLLEPIKQPIIENRDQLYSTILPSFDYWDLSKESVDNPINIDQFYSLLLRQIEHSDRKYSTYIEKEERRLLEAAYNYNKAYDRYQALSNLLQSWNQVLEVTFFECGRFLIDYTNDSKFEMIDNLFNVLQGKESKASIGENITRSIFTLLSRINTSETLEAKNIISVQKKSLKLLLFAKISDTMRQNIYGILLTIIRIVKLIGDFNKEEKKSSLNDLIDNLNINERPNMTVNTNNKMIIDKIISGFNFASDKIVQVIVQDCNKDLPSLSALAVATLDSIISIDKSLKWINSLNTNNQLKILTYKIIKMNDQLASSISPQSSISNILVFENISSLVVSLMRSEMSANIVLESGIVRVLSECDFIERKPKSTLLPLEMERYELLMLPVFRMITSILVHVPKNPKVDNEVKNFILKHFDVLLEILKDEAKSNEHSQLSLVIMITYMVLLLLNRNSDDSNIYSEQFYNMLESFINHLIPIFIRYSELSFQKNEDGVIELNMPVLVACKNILMIFRIMLDKENVDDDFIKATLNYLSQLMLIYDAIKNVINSIKDEYKSNVNEEDYDPDLLEYDYSIKKSQSEVILSNIELILLLATEIQSLAIPISQNAESFLKIDIIDKNTINAIPELIENIKLTSEFKVSTKEQIES